MVWGTREQHPALEGGEAVQALLQPRRGEETSLGGGGGAGRAGGLSSPPGCYRHSSAREESGRGSKQPEEDFTGVEYRSVCKGVLGQPRNVCYFSECV